MKIYFTYNNSTREGYDSRLPEGTKGLDSESVDEISGLNILEKVPDLVGFIEECYRILKKDGKAEFVSPYYLSLDAWTSPITKRGISDISLHFASKEWREKNQWCEATMLADFTIQVNLSIAVPWTARNEEVKSFAMRHYATVAPSVYFTLTKK